MTGRAALIGVDWGTTALRAFLIDHDGGVLERRSGPHGILAVADGNFAAVLTVQIEDWLRSGPLPVLMSGMIGSRQGWAEAPYVAAPAGLRELAAGLLPVAFPAAAVRIVPGVSCVAGMPDVMRGEETQVCGALSRIVANPRRFLLPGTHSKWVATEAGRITGFTTYMTGEIYAACRDHTILGRLMPGEAGGGDPAAFARGVQDGAAAGGPGALLNRLFGVRTAGLFGAIEPAGLADYLSGLLIGAEFADANPPDANPPGTGPVRVAGPVLVIGADALAERYVAAADILGVAAEIAPADCVAAGHLAMAAMAGLIEPEPVRAPGAG